MLYKTYHNKPDITGEYYRTVSDTGRIIEIWYNKSDVNPTLDYHRIQHLAPKNHSRGSWNGRIISEWTSLYDFHNIPF